MNIVICDDDKTFTKDLLNLIKNILTKQSLSASYYIFHSGIDFLKWCESDLDIGASYINFLFIDMQMPCINGLDTLKKFREFNKDCITLIVSNYKSYVFDSFEVDPFDFILKPLDSTQFEKSFTRGLEKYKKIYKKVLLYGNKRHIILSYNELISIESQGKNLLIRTESEEYTVVGKLSDFEIKLKPFGFLRSHKSFLINMDKVIYYENNQFILVNGCIADISQRRRKEIITEFNRYILCQHL